mmetsp:Transcript_9712/g.33419  ORF Transcript_9712/g.33419 Transcript_9712/m.33419 type:complete len:219 (+) Transcript_9712:106-762(+)
MAKLALLLLAPAAALVPSKTASSSTRLAGATLKDPKSSEFAYGLPGNKIPGNELSSFDFDPLGFAERASPADMVKYREAELKHGRMCMLASIGMVVPAIVRVPGEQFQGTYTGWEAHDRLVASGSLGQILLFVGLAETLGGIPAVVATMKGERAPGDFEFGATFKPTDEKELKRKQLAELKNGRLAMLAIMGLLAQDVVSQGAPFDGPQFETGTFTSL